MKLIWKTIGLVYFFSVFFFTLNLKASQSPLDGSEGAEKTKEWFVSGDSTDKERQDHLVEQFCKTNAGQVFQLSKWGKAFFYHGPVETAYIEYLKSLPEEDVQIFIPAFGRGKLIADTLSTHKTAMVFANEIQEENFIPLQKTLDEFFPGTDRVKNLLGDIELILEDISDHSINAVYIGHLFHFFSPEKIRRCMKEIWRVLKPEGRVFLVWLGSAREPYPLPSNDFVKNYEREREFLTKLDLKNPSFLFSETLSRAMKNPYLNDRPIFPYNNSNIDEMLNAVGGSEAFDLLASGEHFGICASLQTRSGLIKLGDYRFEELNKESRITRKDYSLTNYLILSPKSPESAEKFLEEKVLSPEEELAFYVEREMKIKEEIENHSCVQCKKLFPDKSNLKICTGCYSVKYCSRECQTADWKKRHKPQCKELNNKRMAREAAAQAASSTSHSI
jgi:SAM-dependent methyltransferase